MADDSSMMIIVVLIIGMVGSSFMSAAGGFLGYQQGWFDGLFETDPPDTSPPSSSGDDDKKDDDKDKEKTDDKTTAGVPKDKIGKSIFIFSKNCTSGDNWHRFLAVRRQDESQPWMHCKKDKNYNAWVLENTSKWYFYIKNKETGKYLTHDGDYLKLSNKDGDKSKWNFKLQNDTTNEYAIKNKSSGRFLNIHENNCSNWAINGRNVIRMDTSEDDEKSIADSARWKIASASSGPSVAVQSAQANCSNDA